MSARQLTFSGVAIPIGTKNPDRELTPVELKIYRFLKVGARTEKQISLHPTFRDISDIGRALRRLRVKGYVVSRKQRTGPQKWEAVPT